MWSGGGIAKTSNALEGGVVMKIKPGASVRGLEPEMLIGLAVVEEVFAKGNIPLVVTEGTGGTHMPGSLHYEGLAVDIRSRDIAPAAIETVRKEIYAALGNDDKLGIKSEFDFVVEGDHFHLEFQPKGPQSK